jgi:amidase
MRSLEDERGSVVAVRFAVAMAAILLSAGCDEEWGEHKRDASPEDGGMADAEEDGAEPEPDAEGPPFKLVETTIDDIQRAIKKGEITCKQLVQAYVDRIAAYNGPCTQLVTADGAPISPSQGYVRAGALIEYPTQTFPISEMLPDLDQYVGLPIDLGRMEPSISDPSAQQQIGLVTGIPDAGQVNALETINLRGERSIACKGDFDKHPDDGPLPADAPAACEEFRKLPDALERAAELDALYGNKPDLKAMPMYCITFSVKNWYDAKDMRSTGGNDVAFAMDAPPSDSTLVEELRDKGAIILAKSIASQVGNTTSSGPATSTNFFPPSTDNARATWGGTVCTPYDTERSPGFSSGGAGASVATNMVTCGICETTGGSCRIPANPNNVASLVTTKGIISSDDGWTAQFVNHRPGILCRTLGDAARVLDAMKDPETGYFDSEDFFSALPKPLIPDQPYASFTYGDDDLEKKPRLLAGMRIGVVREFMISPNLNNEAINAAIDGEIKGVLRDALDAELVESVDPLYPDDPDVENMSFTFQNALAQILPVSAPEYFFQMLNGALEFAVPGYDVTTKDYLLKLSTGMAPLSENLNLRRITSGLDNALRTPFLMDQYLLERGDEKVPDWPSFVANARWFTDSLRAGSENTATLNVQDIRATMGIDRLKMVTLARLAVSKVMYENGLDVLVTTNIPAPVERNEFARDPVAKDVRPNGPSITDLLGVPEIIVPAGYNQVVYETQYALNAAKTAYVAVPGTVKSMAPHPLPISMMFFAGPGEESAVLMAASAYEAATHHRVPPEGFGPLPGEP